MLDFLHNYQFFVNTYLGFLEIPLFKEVLASKHLPQHLPEHLTHHLPQDLPPAFRNWIWTTWRRRIWRRSSSGSIRLWRATTARRYTSDWRWRSWALSTRSGAACRITRPFLWRSPDCRGRCSGRCWVRCWGRCLGNTYLFAYPLYKGFSEDSGRCWSFCCLNIAKSKVRL